MPSIPCEFSVGLLRLDPVWDPLRYHPRFQALLEKYHTERLYVPQMCQEISYNYK